MHHPDILAANTNLAASSGPAERHNREIRDLGPDDRSHMRAFFLSLSPDDRYSRFQFPANDDFLIRYAGNFDFENMSAVGVFVGDRLEAVGELFTASNEPKKQAQAGEIALTIGRALRGHGMGSVLADCLKKKAQAIGLSQVYASYLHTNMPMRKIASGVGMFVQSRSGGDVLARASLP